MSAIADAIFIAGQNGESRLLAAAKAIRAFDIDPELDDELRSVLRYAKQMASAVVGFQDTIGVAKSLIGNTSGLSRTSQDMIVSTFEMGLKLLSEKVRLEERQRCMDIVKSVTFHHEANAAGDWHTSPRAVRQMILEKIEGEE